ncbi:hypothetical protein [Rubrimonas cliftonensis]|uniref:LytR cell envelope-related transcriptional attenuator n=1 Tax=Rubrimonas cliftonensis TaxID=89524 RepID=A0A1H3W6A6_9RHOB|nr:hypothetical protein [Rubrimonas cliftonensis]SDZ82659.1 hypothetical protein SAMN05444370_101544 [Rubrimonas cliftonensis]
MSRSKDIEATEVADQPSASDAAWAKFEALLAKRAATAPAGDAFPVAMPNRKRDAGASAPCALEARSRLDGELRAEPATAARKSVSPAPAAGRPRRLASVALGGLLALATVVGTIVLLEMTTPKPFRPGGEPLATGTPETMHGLAASASPGATPPARQAVTHAPTQASTPTPEGAFTAPDFAAEAGMAAVRRAARPARPAALSVGPLAAPDRLARWRQAASDPALGAATVRLRHAATSIAAAARASALFRDAGASVSRHGGALVAPDGHEARYFHATDAAAAHAAASALGGGATARDYTSYLPKPAAGVIEVWLAGE